MSDAILFLTGASGSGKTTALEALSRREEWQSCCHFFDSVGVPSPSEMAAKFGDGESWQRQTTLEWIKRLVAAPEPMSILEGQVRPSFINEALAEHPVKRARIVLLDVSHEERRRRLIEDRQQPELATPQMDQWAAYLKGQADALCLPIIDTTELAIEAVVDQIAHYGTRLLDSSAE